MKKLNLIMLLFAMFFSLSIFIPKVTAQVNPYQLSITPKYVKTAIDSTIFPGTYANKRTVTITNEHATKKLKVWNSKSSSRGRDTSSLFIIPPGKNYKVTFTGFGIYRQQESATAADSVYSQVISGDIDLSYKEDELSVAELFAGNINSNIEQSDEQLIYNSGVTLSPHNNTHAVLNKNNLVLKQYRNYLKL